jgi:hypothetical protein
MRPGREVDHLPPSSTDVNEEWSYTSLCYVFLAWMVTTLSLLLLRGRGGALGAASNNKKKHSG